MIQLKSARELELMAQGGKILAATIETLRAAVRPGISTGELDTIAEEFIRSHEGAVPAFKGLYGFPGSICASLNNEIVHGIPSPKRVLKDGDIVSLDVGVGYKGYFTDSATTVPVGTISPEAQRLLDVTQRALAAGIDAAVLGNHIGDIGAAVQGVVEESGFTVVRDLVGHGIGVEFHEEPQVPNYGKAKAARATRRPGLTRGDRADGERRRTGDEDARRPLDDRDARRIAVGALRAHSRDHGKRAEDSDAVAASARG